MSRKRYLKEKPLRVAHFYCDKCGSIVKMSEQCSKCAIEHVVSKYNGKEFV